MINKQAVYFRKARVTNFILFTFPRRELNKHIGVQNVYAVFLSLSFTAHLLT